MNPLRRPEVLVLLLLTAGIAAYFLWSGRHRDRTTPGAAVGTTSGRLAVDSATTVDEAGSRRLRVVYRLENATSLPPQDSGLTPRLRAADGSELPVFFQPGHFPPDRAALQAGSSAAVDFWLKSAPPTPLTLEVAGLTQSIPSFSR